MLGRRAVIGTSIVALAIAGGGGAIAASHGSSPSTKPKVQKMAPRHVVVKAKAKARSGHHCSHSGNISASL